MNGEDDNDSAATTKHLGVIWGYVIETTLYFVGMIEIIHRSVWMIESFKPDLFGWI